MDAAFRQTTIPDLIGLGRQVVLRALAQCADNPLLPCLAVVDGTCGNGHDTLFLAETLRRVSRKPWGVFAFDVQAAALKATRARLAAGRYLESVSLLLQSHAELAGALSRLEDRPRSLAGVVLSPEDLPAFVEGGADAAAPLPVAVAMYNLGFLPRSDKRVTTVAGETLVSLKSAAALLAPHGLLAVHAYAGHPGGLEELEAVDAWCSALPFDEWAAARYTLCNKTRNPEALFVVEKRERS